MSGELIAKLESASEGSRELDAAIADLFDPLPDQHDGYDGRWPFAEGSEFSLKTPPVTTSIDAALALAERVIKVRGPIDLTIMGSAQVVIHNADACGNPLAETYGHTPALAICAALLRASAAEGAGE